MKETAIKVSFNIHTGIRSGAFSPSVKRLRGDAPTENFISDPELIINDSEKRVRNLSDRRTSLSSNTDVSGWVQEALSDDLTESDSDNDDLAPSLDLHLSSDSDSEFNPDESTSDLYLDLRLDTDTDTSSLACSSSNSIDIPQDECQLAGSSSQSSVTVSAFSIFPSAPACQDSEAHPTIRAFIQAMDNIKSNTPESKLEKKLYANLLTIMGKFLAGNKSSPLYQFRNVSVVLTSESLYKSALSIYPGHEVATHALAGLLKKYQALFTHRSHFVSVTDDRVNESGKEIFNTAISDMTDELDAMYLLKPEQIKLLIDALFESMIGTIRQYKLMEPQLILDLILDFQEHSSATALCSLSTVKI